MLSSFLRIGRPQTVRVSSLLAPRRWMSEKAAEGEEAEVPEKRDVERVSMFLRTLSMEDKAESFDSWADLTTATRNHLKQKGFDKCKDRKKFLKAVEMWKQEQRFKHMTHISHVSDNQQN